MRIVTVVGNRPQFIKAAAVCERLRKGHEETLVHTGQHYDEGLSAVFFKELGLPEPDYELGVGSGTHAEQTAEIMRALEPLLLEIAPGLVAVYGDTNSTLAAALTAAKLNLPVAHVEAGMRSFDHTMPEEVNRILVDHCAELLLCPSDAALENLKREGISKGAFVVGDVMVDLAIKLAPVADSRSDILQRLELEGEQFILVTAHRPANVDSAESLLALLELLEALPTKAVLPLHPRTKESLERHGLDQRLAGLAGLTITGPLGYLDTLKLLRECSTLLTDSGGMQKEAYLFGKRCLTMRETTEWVETVELGWNWLVGLDRERALKALAQPLPESRPDLYGAGRAAERLVEVIDGWPAKDRP